jgi:DeoR family fructose operon transcriptional repressor
MDTETVSESPAFPDERQERIAELVATRGKVHVSELTGLFGISEPTARKDLTILEQRGLLKRTHGGAVSLHPPVEDEVASRLTLHREAKQSIARACVELLSPGEAVFFDSGTTVREIAYALAGTGLRVTILTDSPSVAEAVADLAGVSHVLIGGQLRRISGCVVGPLATENLKEFAITTAFMGVSGVTEGGITVSDLLEAQLKAAVIAKAGRVILPIDHSKVGISDFARVCGLNEVDMIVTDRVDEHLEKLCRVHGIQLVKAKGQA